MASREEYYGSDIVESLSFLEFGSIDIVNKKRTTWAYWQDQEAYDLYMFARYARDLFSFRTFIEKGNYSLDELNRCIKNSAHDKLLDYIFKYVGLLIFRGGYK